MLLHNGQVSLVEIRSLTLLLSSLLSLLFLTFFFALLFLSTAAFFLLSLFHFYSDLKYLMVVHFASFAISALHDGFSGIIFRFSGSLLVNFHNVHFYCILILRNLLHHFPSPSFSFLVEEIDPQISLKSAG